MRRTVLIITALQCEAAPLISAWQLKPLRENSLGERFQVFSDGETSVAVSGVGKIRAAIATSVLLSALLAEEVSPIVMNIGIAGSSTRDLAIGSLVYVNKVRDVATNSRLYPDVLLAHGLPEAMLETHDAPVTTPPSSPLLVDMEGAGFLQAALTLISPSQTCILKVVSDYCTNYHITPVEAQELISSNISVVTDIVTGLRNELPEPARMTEQGRALLESVCLHAGLTLAQRIELGKVLRSLQAQGICFEAPLKTILSTSVATKDVRNRAYHSLLRELRAEVSL